jgi:hypothetical protein
MALKNCKEYGKPVSTKARACVGCGAPLLKRTSRVVKLLGYALLAALLFGIVIPAMKSRTPRASRAAAPMEPAPRPRPVVKAWSADPSDPDAAFRNAIAPMLATPALAAEAQIIGPLAAVRTKPGVVLYFRRDDAGKVEFMGNVAPKGWTGVDDARPYLASVEKVYGKPSRPLAERVFAGKVAHTENVGIVNENWRETVGVGEVQTWQVVFRVTLGGAEPKVELIESAHVIDVSLPPPPTVRIRSGG